MSEKIIVKLRRDNISVSSCKEGVYLTFDAENARPIICKYSEVITIFTPNQIYDVEHYCPVKILDLEINRVDHHPLGR